MCGIAGAVWTDPRLALSSDGLRRMTEALRHRGPDDEGFYTSDFQLRPGYDAQPGVALGHRRLAIIDTAHNTQPIGNEDGSVQIVFNGEVYNYLPLRKRLEGSGHRFRTAGDTETIVHLFEDLGTEAFAHLDGMLAAAIWDARHRRLVLVRDRLGKKPLLYRLEAGRLLFASELKSLLQVPGVPRDVDPGSIDEYLTYNYVPPPNTIFRGIHKLPPGHFAVYQDGRLRVEPYWQPAWNVESSVSVPQAAKHIRELFDAAVLARMQSDVPLGAFLSGGIDSSLIAASMQRQSLVPVKTYNIGFSQPEYDESPYARRVAQFLGTEHHEFQVTPDAAVVIPQLIQHYDEPFADSSAIPTYYVSQLARQHVTVALTGDGGDELFGGYARYRAVALAASLDRFGPLRDVLALPAWQWIPASVRQRSPFRKFRRFSASLAKPAVRRYFDWISLFGEERRALLYRDEFVAELPDNDPFAFLHAAWKKSQPRNAMSCAANADLLTYLPGDLLVKVDIASMAHGLECRQPFLDHRLVEFAASLPWHMKVHRGKGKRILQTAFGERLPEEVWRRPKMGFGVPLEHWFRKELRGLTHDALLSDGARTAVYFRPEAVRQLVNEHERFVFDHSARLWGLLFLELWLQEWTAA